MKTRLEKQILHKIYEGIIENKGNGILVASKIKVQISQQGTAKST